MRKRNSTMQVYVDVDMDEVISELSNQDLIDELKERGQSVEALEISFNDDIEWAAKTGNAYELLGLIQQALGINGSPDLRASKYEKLERDPSTGRPVIQ